MKRYCSIFLVVFVFAAGCRQSNRARINVWKDITAAELIGRQEIEQAKVKTVGLNIYTFQIDSTRLPEIQHLMYQTSTLPISYSSSGHSPPPPDAASVFSSNGLICCAGDKNDWQKISKPLFKSKSTSRINKSTSLYAVENISDDVIVGEILQPVSILYYSGGTAASGVGLDAGQVGLRIKTSSPIGLRQVCRIEITPIYKIGLSQKTKQPANQSNREFIFESAAMITRLGIGQFILIAPAAAEAYPEGIKTIGDIMFYPQKPQKTVTLYLIACNTIKEPI